MILEEAFDLLGLDASSDQLGDSLLLACDVVIVLQVHVCNVDLGLSHCWISWVGSDALRLEILSHLLGNLFQDLSG
mgnify:CR=1 FL=1